MYKLPLAFLLNIIILLFTQNINAKTQTVKLPDSTSNSSSVSGLNAGDSVDPFFDFAKIKQHMDDLFTQTVNRFGFHDDLTKTTAVDLDLKNEADKFVITLPMHPSTKSQHNSINARMDGERMLVVSGKVTEQRETTSKTGKQAILYTSSFTKSITLPERVNPDSIETKITKDSFVITIQKTKQTLAHL